MRDRHGVELLDGGRAARRELLRRREDPGRYVGERAGRRGFEAVPLAGASDLVVQRSVGTTVLLRLGRVWCARVQQWRRGGNRGGGGGGEEGGSGGRHVAELNLKGAQGATWCSTGALHVFVAEARRQRVRPLAQHRAPGRTASVTSTFVPSFKFRRHRRLIERDEHFRSEF